MTPATPLVEETEFETGNPEVAREFLAEAYGDQKLRVDSPIVDDRVISIHRYQTPRVNVNRVAIPGEVEMQIAGMDDEVLIATIHEGTASIDHRGWYSEGTGLYGPGDATVTNLYGVEWTHKIEPLRNTTVGISETLLREVSGSDPDDANLHWEAISTEPLPGRSRLWREASRFLDDVLSEPAIAEAPLVIGPAERLVAAAALNVFPNTFAKNDHLEGQRDAHPDTLRRAMAYIEANPQTDITPVDLGEAANASPRSVQAAFRRHLGTTPREYLRRVRLTHARRELLAGNPVTTTVREIGVRWGFSNPSRFAEYYHREYGEKPSETLRS